MFENLQGAPLSQTIKYSFRSISVQVLTTVTGVNVIQVSICLPFDKIG